MIRIPITTLLPAFGMFYFGLTAEAIDFNDQFIEFQYSPISLKVINSKNYEKLPDIKSNFEAIPEG